MAQHPFLQNLLNGQAVEWKLLGEIAEITRGVTYNKSLEVEKNGYRILRANNITVEFSKLNFDDVKQISKEAKVKDTQKLYENDILISVASGSREHVGKVAFIHEDIDFYFGGFMAVIRTKKLVNPRYMFHILKSHYFSQFLEKTFASATINNLSNSVLKEFQIPIPPLSVQTKIVQILDTMTAITAELTAELAAELDMRNKQYQYYRDFLLSENELAKVGFEWKTLGEVAQYSKNRINANELDQDSYIGVDNLLQNRAGKTSSNHVPTDGRVASYQEDDILIGNIRPYLKKIWQANNNGGASGDVLIIQITDENINPRYLYQVLSDDKFFDYNMQHAKGAKMPRGNKDAILNYQIPIPPLAEQARIVAILDKFDTLTQSISDGLPREIELRQKQYAYYREALLSF